MNRLFATIAGRIAMLAGRPLTFILALSCVVVWGLTGPAAGYSEAWQLVINTGTTVVTFLMIFLVQNTQNRDASAMQAKLDELLRVVDQARVDFIGIEHLTDIEIDRIRERLEIEDGPGAERRPSHEAVERLLSRRR